MNKEELYKQIMKDITGHKDFGKKHPLDIGSECGYSQEDIFAALNMPLIETKEEELEYFILKDTCVVSVNLFNRKVALVKKLSGKCNAKVKYGVLAWDDSESVSNAKNIYWENLKNGKKGNFSLEKNSDSEDEPSIFGFAQKTYIRGFFILQDGILVETNKKLYVTKYSGEILNIEYNENNYISVGLVVENENHICMANLFGVFRLSKDYTNLEKLRDYSADDNKTVSALECENGNIYYHIFDESGWNHYYRKYSMDGDSVSEEAYLSGKFYDQIGYVANPIEIITTENYMLHNNAIYKKGRSSAVWGSAEGLLFVHQAVGIYSKDIILGVVTGLGAKNRLGVTMFDLKKRQTPVLLPFED